MTDKEKNIVYELIQKELRGGLKLLPNARTLHEMKLYAKEHQLKYWLELFELSDKIMKGGVK
tara:strand:- start:99 stop:284 length:186 start_codon:yes stop_codon:yes gene_type:complete